jgi:ABC-type transporter Mla subunit MlaD
MASAFNLTAQLNLRGPSNIRQVVSDIRKQLGTVTADVKLNVAPSAINNTTKLSKALQDLNNNLNKVAGNARAASDAIKSFGSSINSISSSSSKLSSNLSKVDSSSKNLGSNVAKTAKSIGVARTEMEEFGRQSALAVRRFAAFSAVTSVFFGLNRAINNGIKSFIEFDRQLVRLQQVTGKNADGIRSIQEEVTRLSTSLGVTSQGLIDVASTLAQAGLSAKETQVALRALALTELAPSFDDINKTVEGSIALMRQFGIASKDLEKALGSVNSVAAAFAVESGDIIAAIQRTGGVFASASKGVSEGTDALNEFIAVFTSVRQTTRESAETIATGLRTIFTRIQRQGTIEALREYGVTLTDVEGKFVGAYKAIELLSQGLSRLDPRDLRFSQIVEELGGFRQIGKVIPLIQQFATAQEALKIAQAGQGSLAADAVKAQLSLANQITKVREEFLSLIRSLGQSDTFQTLAKGALGFASGLIKISGALKGVLPALTILAAGAGIRALTQFTGGFVGGLKKVPQGGGGAAGGPQSISGAIGQNLGATLVGAKTEQVSRDLDQNSAALDKVSGKLDALGTNIGKLDSSINNLNNNFTAINNTLVTYNSLLQQSISSLATNTTSLDNLTNAVNNLNLGGGPTTARDGGKILGFNKGGVVPGSGKGDKVPAMLEPGEVVMNNRATSRYGRDNLNKLNKGGRPRRFWSGGISQLGGNISSFEIKDGSGNSLGINNDKYSIDTEKEPITITKVIADPATNKSAVVEVEYKGRSKRIRFKNEDLVKPNWYKFEKIAESVTGARKLDPSNWPVDLQHKRGDLFEVKYVESPVADAEIARKSLSHYFGKSNIGYKAFGSKGQTSVTNSPSPPTGISISGSRTFTPKQDDLQANDSITQLYPKYRTTINNPLSSAIKITEDIDRRRINTGPSLGVPIRRKNKYLIDRAAKAIPSMTDDKQAILNSSVSQPLDLSRGSASVLGLDRLNFGGKIQKFVDGGWVERMKKQNVKTLEDEFQLLSSASFLFETGERKALVSTFNSEGPSMEDIGKRELYQRMDAIAKHVREKKLTDKEKFASRRGPGLQSTEQYDEAEMLDAITYYQAGSGPFTKALASGKKTFKDPRGDKYKTTDIRDRLLAASQFTIPKKTYSGLGRSQLREIISDTGITAKKLASKPSEILKSLVGQKIDFPTFLSVSADKEQAEAFIQNPGALLDIDGSSTAQKTIDIIKAKNKTRVSEETIKSSRRLPGLEKISDKKLNLYDDEKEFIIPPNTPFQITKASGKISSSFVRDLENKKIVDSENLFELYFDEDDEDFEKTRLNFKAKMLSGGGLVNRLAKGGVAQRNLGYIDYDVIANEANSSVVEAGMKKSGVKGPRLYADYLTDLAIKKRKDNSLSKLRAIYGVSGSGKTTLARGQGTDDATLRQTTRFPVLTPEDIDRANEVILLSSTVSKKKLDQMFSEVDRAYTLSSTTREEKDRVKNQRASRDATGVGLEGRKPGTTSSVSRDTAVGEALLGDRLGSRSVVLGRTSSGRLRRKKDNELVEIIKKRIGVTWGGFAPMTLGHESIMDSAKAMGISPEDFLYLVGSNEGIKLGDASSYRTAILNQDARLLLTKAGAGAKGATVLPKAADFEVPIGFDISEAGADRRKVLLPGAGSVAFVADKTEEQLAKYTEAGYKTKNLERMGGISGTMVRDLIAEGNLGELQNVLSPGVYELISNNIGRIQNRANILPSLIEQVQQSQAVKLGDVEKQIKSVGISRIEKKKMGDPEYAAKAETLLELRDLRDKIKNSGSFEPYRLLDKLAADQPDKYGLDFTLPETIDPKPIRTVGQREKVSFGGLIQRFMAGGQPEEDIVAPTTRGPLLDMLGIRGAAEAAGTDLFTIREVLGKRSRNAAEEAMFKAVQEAYITKVKRKRGSKKGGQTRAANLGLAFAAAGLFGTARPTTTHKAQGTRGERTVTLVTGVADPALALELESMFLQETNSLAQRAADIVMTRDIISKFQGGSRELALDFDKTLAVGADDITDLKDFRDPTKVAEQLQKAKLTTLGSSLVDLVRAHPEVLPRMKVITARPENTTALISQWLSDQGLPIPLVTGVGGNDRMVSSRDIPALKAATLSSSSLFVDDDPANIAEAMKSGKGIETYQYGSGTEIDNINTDSSIQGGLLEKMVQRLGGPGAVKGLGFDFPEGLGPAARYFGIPDNLPTDFKRTISDFSTVEKNVETYLKVNGFNRGGLVQSFEAGGVADRPKRARSSKTPFGSGEYEFPKRISNAYVKEMTKLLEAQKIETAWEYYPKDERLLVDDAKVLEMAQQPFNRESFIASFKDKIGRNTVFERMGQFAQFVGLPPEDFLSAIPTQLDFGGPNLSGAGAVFNADPSGSSTRGLQGVDLTPYGFSENDKQDLFGYSRLADEKSKEILKTIKTPVTTYDDGSFSYDTVLVKKLQEELKTIQAKQREKADLKNTAIKAAKEDRLQQATASGRGGVSIMTDIFDTSRRRKNDVLYHELTHQLINSLRTKNAQSFENYKSRVSSLFEGDNDDVALAYDALVGSKGSGYNSADVAYGRSYKLSGLSSLITGSTKESFAKYVNSDPEYVPELRKGWADAKSAVTAKTFRPINPKINDILLKGKIDQDVITKYEDNGKEEFLTTLMQNLPVLDDNLGMVLDSTLTELLGSAGIQRKRYSIGGTVKKFVNGGLIPKIPPMVYFDELEAYKNLGLTFPTLFDSVRTKYQELIKTNHPDKGGDPEAFKKVQKSYMTLLKIEQMREISRVLSQVMDEGDALRVSMARGKRGEEFQSAMKEWQEKYKIISKPYNDLATKYFGSVENNIKFTEVLTQRQLASLTDREIEAIKHPIYQEYMNKNNPEKLEKINRDVNESKLIPPELPLKFGGLISKFAKGGYSRRTSKLAPQEKGMLPPSPFDSSQSTTDYYSLLDKYSEIPMQEFDPMVSFAKTNDLNLQEFETYLQKRIQYRQQQANIKPNISNLINQLKTPERFASGGQAKNNIIRSTAGNSLVAKFGEGSPSSGEVAAASIGDGLYAVTSSQTSGGGGRSLYDAVMEMATSQGSKLVSDRSRVSDSALAKIWTNYFSKGVGQDGKPVSKSSVAPDKMYTGSFFKEIDYPEPDPSTWTGPAVPLQYSYSKFANGGTIPALVSNGEAYVPPKVAKSIGYGTLNRMNQADRNGMGRFSEGGISVFKGPGSGTSDSIPTNLPVGSFIIREKATKALGLNKGGGVGVRRFFVGGQADKDTARARGRVLDTIDEASQEFGSLMETLGPEIRSAILENFKGIKEFKADDTINIGGKSMSAERSRGLARFGKSGSSLGFQIKGDKAAATTETVAHETGHLADVALGGGKKYASEMEGTFQFDLIEKVKPQMIDAFVRAGKSSDEINQYLASNRELFAEFFAKASPEVRSIITSTTDAKEGMKKLAASLGGAGFTYAGLEASDIAPTGSSSSSSPKPDVGVMPDIGFIKKTAIVLADSMRNSDQLFSNANRAWEDISKVSPALASSLDTYLSVVDGTEKDASLMIQSYRSIVQGLSRQGLTSAQIDAAMQQYIDALDEASTQSILATSPTAPTSGASPSPITTVPVAPPTAPPVASPTVPPVVTPPSGGGGPPGDFEAKVQKYMMELENVASSTKQQTFKTERLSGAIASEAKARADAAAFSAYNLLAQQKLATATTEEAEAINEARTRMSSVKGGVDLFPSRTAATNTSTQTSDPTKPLVDASVKAADEIKLMAMLAEQSGVSLKTFQENLKRDIGSTFINLKNEIPKLVSSVRSNVAQNRDKLTSSETDVAQNAAQSLAEDIRRTIGSSNISGVSNEQIDTYIKELQDKLKNSSMTFDEAINSVSGLRKALDDASTEAQLQARTIEMVSSSSGFASETIKDMAESAIKSAESFEKTQKETSRLSSMFGKQALIVGGVGSALSSIIQTIGGSENKTGVMAGAAVSGASSTFSTITAARSQALPALDAASAMASKIGGPIGKLGSTLLPMVKNLIGGPFGLAATAAISIAGALKDAYNAARDFDLNQTQKRLDNSISRVTNLFDEFSKDSTKLDFLDKIDKELSYGSQQLIKNLQTDLTVPKAFWTNLLDLRGGAQSAGRSMILEKEGIGSYLSSLMDNNAQQRAIARLAPEKAIETSQKAQPQGQNILRQFENRLRSGANIEDLLADLKTAGNETAEVLARMNPKINEQIMLIQNDSSLTSKQQQAQTQQIIAFEANRVAALNMKNAMKQIEFEKLGRETNNFAASLERMFSGMEQAINKADFELTKLSRSAELSAAALSGNAKAGDVMLDSINVIQNPRAYSGPQQGAAFDQVAGMFGSQAGLIRPLLGLGDKLESTVMSTINNAVQSNPNASTEGIAGNIRAALDKQLRGLGLPSNIADKLAGQTREAFAKIQSKGEDQRLNFDQVVEEVPAFAKAISSAQRAQELAVKAMEFYQKNLNEYAQAMNQMVDFQIEANSRMRKASEIQAKGNMELSRTLGKRITLNESRQVAQAPIKSMTGGLTEARDIGRNVINLENTRRVQQTSADSASNRGPAGKDEFALMQNRLRGTNTALRENIDALKQMADSTELAQAALQKIQEVQAKRQAGANLIEKMVTSSPEELAKLNASIGRLNNNMRGGLNIGSTSEQRGETLQTFNMLAPLLGDGQQQNELKANVLESMLKESGIGIDSTFQGVLDSLRDPEGDPQMAEAISVYRESLNQQTEANRVLAELQNLMAANTAEVAATKLANAIGSVKLNFDQQVMSDIRDKIQVLIDVVKQNVDVGKDPIPAAGKKTGGIIYASMGQAIDFAPKGTDTVPAMLTPGEFVVNRAATQANLPLLQNINSGKYSNGGKVGYYNDGGYVLSGGRAKGIGGGEQEEKSKNKQKEIKNTLYTRKLPIVQKYDNNDFIKMGSIRTNSFISIGNSKATGIGNGFEKIIFNIDREGVLSNLLGTTWDNYIHTGIGGTQSSNNPIYLDSLFYGIKNTKQFIKDGEVSEQNNQQVIDDYEKLYSKLLNPKGRSGTLIIEKLLPSLISTPLPSIMPKIDPVQDLRSEWNAGGTRTKVATISNISTPYTKNNNLWGLFEDSNAPNLSKFGGVGFADYDYPTNLWGRGSVSTDILGNNPRRFAPGLEGVTSFKFGGSEDSLSVPINETKNYAENTVSVLKLIRGALKSLGSYTFSDVDLRRGVGTDDTITELTESDEQIKVKNTLSKLDSLYNKKIFSIDIDDKDFVKDPITLYNIQNEQSWNDIFSSLKTKYTELVDKQQAPADKDRWTRIYKLPVGQDYQDFPWISQKADIDDSIFAKQRLDQADKVSKELISIEQTPLGSEGGKYFIPAQTITSPFIDKNTRNYTDSQKYLYIPPKAGGPEFNPLYNVEKPIAYKGTKEEFESWLNKRLPNWNKETKQETGPDIAGFPNIVLSDGLGLVNPINKNSYPILKDLPDEKIPFLLNSDNNNPVLEQATIDATVYQNSRQKRIEAADLSLRKQAAEKATGNRFAKLTTKESAFTANTRTKLAEQIQLLASESLATYGIRVPNISKIEDVGGVAAYLKNYSNKIDNRSAQWAETNAWRALFSELFQPKNPEAAVSYLKTFGVDVANRTINVDGIKNIIAREKAMAIGKNVSGEIPEDDLKNLDLEVSKTKLYSVGDDGKKTELSPDNIKNPKTVQDVEKIALVPENLFESPDKRQSYLNVLSDYFTTNKLPEFSGAVNSLKTWYGAQDSLLNTSLDQAQLDNRLNAINSGEGDAVQIIESKANYDPANILLTGEKYGSLPDKNRMIDLIKVRKEEAKTEENKQKAEDAGNFATGGMVYASGGRLINFQPRGTDTVPAMLTPGEFVINRDSTQKYKPVLEAINNGSYSRGGIVNYLSNGGYLPIYRRDGGNTPSGSMFDFTSFMNNIVGAVASSITQAFDKALSDLKQPNNGVGGVSNNSSDLATIDNFVNRLNNIATILSNIYIPPQITITGKHDVIVTINGDTVLNQLRPDIAGIVVSAIKGAFADLKTKNPENNTINFDIDIDPRSFS